MLLDRLRHEPAAPTLGDEPISEEIRLALGRLSHREREALVLVVWEGLNHGEAATVLGCSANAVGIRVHKGRNRLAQILTRRETVMPGALGSPSHDMEVPR
jgi:DNA-directed RNA polymerase specialized sigma24 family protein